jgi:Pectate lyase superfamily protein
MQRRDLSKILLASTATSALAMRSVQAQTCTAPCYARTAPEIAAGVMPTNLAYPQGDVRRYGADPTGSADSTTGIQNALNVGQAVYIAGGTYKITAALTNSVANRRIYGDGPAVSILRPQGAINTLVNTAPLSCVLMDNFGIFTTDTTTLDGITQSPSVPLYESRFENIAVWVGGRAFYLPSEFNTQLVNCQGSSYSANVFELNGGNTTLLQGCYAHQVPTGCYGYRIYGTAQLDSCNGIDSPAGGGDWGMFGAVTGEGDPVNALYRVTLTNCNIEAFNNTGIRLRNNGFAKITGGAFVPPSSGTYQAEIYVEYCNGLVIVENVAFFPPGATRAKKAPIFAADGCAFMMIGPCFSPAQFDSAGTLTTLPTIQTSFPSSIEAAVNINCLDVSHLYSRYAGAVALSSGTATVTFAVPQLETGYHVLVTGNVGEIFSVTNKTLSGFVINSNNPGSLASVDWMLVRTGT